MSAAHRLPFEHLSNNKGGPERPPFHINQKPDTIFNLPMDDSRSEATTAQEL
jgi:hypothetical protein